MKNFDIAQLVSWHRGRRADWGLRHGPAAAPRDQPRLDHHSVLDLLHSVGDDALAGFSPPSITRETPKVLPGLTVRSVTLLSAPTTATWYCPWVSRTAR